MLRQVLIVGAGQAAVQAIDTLRRRGYDGGILLVGDEPLEPYQRPPLSKAYLAGALETDRLLLRPAAFYRDHHVELHLGARAIAVDPSRQAVRLEDGHERAYEALILATGSRPRRLEVPGAGLDGVFYLRTAAQARCLREALAPGLRLVVIGGGYIGLEVAATCRALGLEVTVLEMAERVLARVAAPAVSAFFEAEHRQRGVQIVPRAQVRAFAEAAGTRRVQAVVSDRGRFPADLVVVGIGVAPADELAAAAGLECSGGILVNERCCTTDPHIHAAGDCTSRRGVPPEPPLHLESVDNAFAQGTSAALDLLGLPAPPRVAPWFWSDQFDLKLVIVGVPRGHDAVVARGASESRSFSVCYLKAGALLAVETVNRPQDQLAARRLVGSPARFDPVRLADTAIPLADCRLGADAQSAK